MRAKSSAEGSCPSLRNPAASMDRLTVGELLLKDEAAVSPMLFEMMKSSMILVLGRPKPPPVTLLLPPRHSARASRMRAKSAAEGFRALDRSPRARAFR